MIQTIRIGRLLRETVMLPYPCLVTRPTGAAVRGRIEAALAHTPCHTAWLDFSDVELLDLSCADEVVAKLLLAEPQTPPPFLVLRGLREEQHEAIEHVLTHHRLAITATRYGAEEPCLVGWASADARAAFDTLIVRDGAAPAELAAAMGWVEGRAREALQALVAHRVLRSDGERYRPLRTA
ncbi:MAG TPA: hypothetical protein VJQ44_12070 [Gemmatimonadales bacterium]|nr:hypothetical protein [Gemmatimonadales bacterium]